MKRDNSTATAIATGAINAHLKLFPTQDGLRERFVELYQYASAQLAYVYQSYVKLHPSDRDALPHFGDNPLSMPLIAWLRVAETWGTASTLSESGILNGFSRQWSEMRALMTGHSSEIGEMRDRPPIEAITAEQAFIAELIESDGKDKELSGLPLVVAKSIAAAGSDAPLIHWLYLLDTIGQGRKLVDTLVPSADRYLDMNAILQQLGVENL